MASLKYPLSVRKDKSRASDRKEQWWPMNKKVQGWLFIFLKVVAGC